MIETNRLILRPFQKGDLEDLYAYLKEPLVHCFASMQTNTLEDAKVALKHRMQNDEYCFAIVLKKNGMVIGEIDAHCETSQPDIVNGIYDTFSPCWMLNKDYLKQGYMYEAAHAFFEYLFHDKQARRIYTYTEDDNIACQKLCEKLGMRQEGLFKQFVTFVNDEEGHPIYENTYQYAILKDEFISLGEYLCFI